MLSETAPFHHSFSFTSILCSVSSLIVFNLRNATLLCRVISVFISVMQINLTPYRKLCIIAEAFLLMKLVISSKKVSLAKPIFHTAVLTGTKYAVFKFFNACIQYQSFHNWTQNQHPINWVNTTWDFPSTPVQMLALFAILFSLVEFPSCSKISLNLTVAGHTAPLPLILKQLTASYWKFSLVSHGSERMPLSLKDRNMPSFF